MDNTTLKYSVKYNLPHSELIDKILAYQDSNLNVQYFIPHYCEFVSARTVYTDSNQQSVEQYLDRYPFLPLCSYKDVLYIITYDRQKYAISQLKLSILNCNYYDDESIGCFDKLDFSREEFEKYLLAALLPDFTKELILH